MFSLLQILAIVSITLCFVTAWWYLTIPSNLPPGPLGLPIFGSMLDTRNATDLHTKLCEWTKLYGPIYKFYVADKLVLVLGDMSSLREAFVRQGDIYAGRPRVHYLMPNEFGHTLGIMAAEGDLWKEQRHFALSTLRDFGIGKSILEPRIKEEVNCLLGDIAKYRGRPFDPTSLLNNAIANVICGLVFGKRFRYDQPDFAELLSLLSSLLQKSNISPLAPFMISERVGFLMAKITRFKRFKDDRLTIIRFLQKEIAQLKNDIDSNGYFNEEPTTYVHAFYKAQKDPSRRPTFTDAQLLANVLNLFTAGTDSTATTLRWALFYLARNPKLQEQIYGEIYEQTGSRAAPSNADRLRLPLTEATIMEVQRLANLTPLGVLRRTNASSKLFGYDIPEDTVVVPLLTAVMLDPLVYPNPTMFDPGRFLQKEMSEEVYKTRMSHFVPFQLGKRVCLGESLARMELFLFFTGLVTRFQFRYSSEEPLPSDDGIAAFNRAPVEFNICAKVRKR